MTEDETFLTEFEACRWPLDRWHHPDHVKLAYLYLCQLPFEEALLRIREGIKAHNAKHRVSESRISGYHETMTHAWLSLVHFAIQEYGLSSSADSFIDDHPELSQKETLRLFYSRELLMSADAKTKICEPDLTPFPSVESKCETVLAYKRVTASFASQLTFRDATTHDIERLAQWNHQLIRDEGHRNPMTQAELANRMRGWLKEDYRATIFETENLPVAYALFREQPDELYLRQFFVVQQHRLQGVGKRAVALLRERWPSGKRLTVDVLTSNAAAVSFWRRVGYSDYSLTLEIAARSSVSVDEVTDA